MNALIKDKKNWVILGLAILCLALLLFRLTGDTAGRKTVRVADARKVTASKNAEVWTCSMHPQIQLPEPGKCPICGMDLIPLKSGSDVSGWSLTLSPTAIKLAEIRLAPVERKLVPREIHMVGKVAYDEKRLGVISARVPGRIDRLFVDFTGIEVRKGDHMVGLYSPRLLSAQQEYLQALKTYRSGHESLRAAAGRRVEAAREKLRLLGLSREQIEKTEADDALSDHLTIEAPMGGVVIEKHLNEGAYVETGTPIYTMADLSRVWIQLDAYESDLAWLRYGQEVKFQVEAYPGETFGGRIVFIDPVLNPKTRTVKVRMDVPNPNGRLKPDMFVRARVQAVVSPGGKAMDPSLAGKWISPMHPEIVKDGPGQCDVCGMDLVKAEDLGFLTTTPADAPLVVPASAVLLTGERAVVYVADEEEPGRFEGREVVPGPRAGDDYVVVSGLDAGELVVVNGAFKIDSELQIRARTSMMYRGQSKTGAMKSEASEALKPLLQAYFTLATRLSEDALAPSREAAADMLTGLEDLDIPENDWWAGTRRGFVESLKRLANAESLAGARKPFTQISGTVEQLVKEFGAPPHQAVYKFHCPMAFDNSGADWLQEGERTANPYFGKSMLGCGSLVERINDHAAETEDGGHRHE